LAPLLSIIIPAHNEEFRLPASLEKVLAFLRTQEYEAEIIIVENGSKDRTAEIAQAAAAQYPQVRWIQETTAGKGLAVRRGMLGAKGDFRFICDADLSMPIEEVNRFLPPASPPYDVAIASREIPGAIRYDEPAYRHWIGRVFNWLVRIITLPGLQDTQCGFKCFRAEVAENLFPDQTIIGWTFDVEILFLAMRRGYRIIEIPIPWYYNPGSRVRILRDSFYMLSDLFQIRLNAFLGRYDSG
jgi:glycosyltransferase involved in cell wall biosynthesis